MIFGNNTTIATEYHPAHSAVKFAAVKQWEMQMQKLYSSRNEESNN